VMTDQWRLINGSELYDVREDPGQQRNVADAHAEVVQTLRDDYERWWASLTPAFDAQVRIVLGNDAENPATLTCHDWHSDDVPWHQGAIQRDPAANGYWWVEIEQAGRYAFTLRSRPAGVDHPLSAERARVRIGDVEAQADVSAEDSAVTLTVDLQAGPAKLQTWLEPDGGPSRGAYFVTVERLDE
jgi:hypothetical protein